jgi:hypothetical protein
MVRGEDVTIDGITVDSMFFQPIRISEEVMEGLIRTAAPALFPGYDYFDFRPPIRCGTGTRHPDGALLARDDGTWWVVEVETHLHSVAEHIEPQLGDLATGFYGPDAFRFLRRHRTFEASLYDVDMYEPSFLLIIDSLTAEIREAATRTGFQAVECSPFRSQRNQYALAVSGHRPRRDLAPAGTGLDLHLREESGMAVLCPVDGRPVPPLRSNDIIVSDVVHTGYVRSDGSGIVLPITPDELEQLLPGAESFRLTSPGQLMAIPGATSTILVKE